MSTSLALADLGPKAAGWVPGLPGGRVPAGLGAAIGQAVAADMRRRFQTSTAPDGTPWAPLANPRPAGGNKPLLDAGTLRNSITGRAEPTGGSAGTNAVSARLHSEGGTVVAKQAKALAIPLTKEAKRAGSPRRFPRKLFFLGRADDPRGGVLAERVGKGKRARVVVHYLLRRSVTVPARPFDGLSAEGRRAVEGLVTDFLARGG